MKIRLLLLLMFLVLGFAPFLTAHHPRQTQAESQLLPPSSEHLLGTDYLGRDVLSRTLYGGRRTILIAFSATFLAACGGFFFGYFSNLPYLRFILTSLLNAMLAFPSLLLALVVLTLLGRGSIQISLALALAQLPFFARMTYTAIAKTRYAPYIEAAKALGANERHLLFQHIFPTIRPMLLTYAGMVFSYSIINSAALSFLGLGQDPSVPDWGMMLADGRNAFRQAPWVALAPGLAITMTVMLVNKIIDQLNAE